MTVFFFSFYRITDETDRGNWPGWNRKSDRTDIHRLGMHPDIVNLIMKFLYVNVFSWTVSTPFAFFMLACFLKKYMFYK